MASRRLSRFALSALAAVPLSAQQYTFDQSQQFLKQYCQPCHVASSAGKFNVSQVSEPGSIASAAERWNRITLRIRNGEMPPKGLPAPPVDQRELFLKFATDSVRAAACSAGAMPGPSPTRRMNREEYGSTVQDLLDIQMDLASPFPSEGAGGEGFDNAGETLFITPLLSEKYMQAAKYAMDFAGREYKSRERIFVARPGKGVTHEQAAHDILKAFLPRAFRRPVTEDDINQYLALYRSARKQGQDFEPAVLFTLRGVLVSPRFVFLTEPPNTTGDMRRLDQYSLANRMSYFLWGSLPDELMTDLAAMGKLHEPGVVQALIPRMLRREQALVFAKRFTDQWLHIRDLDRDKAPDPKVFPTWATDEDLRSDIRLQPSLFFYEVLKRDLSVLSMLDSTSTVLTRKLIRHFGESITVTADALQPQWVELPKGSTRGGVLSMPAVLAVSSHPYRTSPVLRGAWILDSILGTPPPPPPADVPSLDKQADAEKPKTVREMLTAHRANPVCASCHNRIDPLGFALENYDQVGRWREQDAGKPIDNTGELPDGTAIAGQAGLKQALLDRKELFVRNLTSRMLGYALGRGLTLADSCTVDRIVNELKDHDYKAQKLIELVVLSVPFQYQAPSRARKE